MTGKSKSKSNTATLPTPKALRKVPRVNMDSGHPFPEGGPTADELRDLLGVKTSDAAVGILATAFESMAGDALNSRQLLLAMFAEEEPQTAIEAMLLVQMVAVHVQTTKLASSRALSKSTLVTVALSKAMNNSARTFANQALALKKYRSEVSQTVRIERVNVGEGGRRLSATSVQSGGGRMKNDDNPMQRAHQAPRCTATSKRSGKPCRAPAVRGFAVCRMHGARGGAPKGQLNGNYVHGMRTEEVQRALTDCRQTIAEAKELLDALGTAHPSTDKTRSE